MSFSKAAFPRGLPELIANVLGGMWAESFHDFEISVSMVWCVHY